MKSITELFSDALKKRKERHFSNFYIALDLHGTVFRPSKKTKISDNSDEKVIVTKDSEAIPYRFALDVLKLLTISDSCKIILWTSSPKNKAEMFKALLEDNGIKIAYINENPEYSKNEYADFSKKFCFDILLDDKAGFDPENDWERLWDFLNETDWRKFYVSNH